MELINPLKWHDIPFGSLKKSNIQLKRFDPPPPQDGGG